MLGDKRKYIYNVPNLKLKRQYLRNNATNAEKTLWQELKNSKIGYKFRRQFSVTGYILDFYCPEKRLAVELDGEIHKSKTKYDRYRDQYLEAMVIKTIRFTNNQVENDLQNVIKVISGYLSPSCVGGGVHQDGGGIRNS
ncbi:MAG: endonuclease domain-containing protein [Candidatus Amesbacteria bacterium]|nr:endonuclease domain-containing protein [Candidatus Amesbacteria bacterium]